jgi:hypothetical protein
VINPQHPDLHVYAVHLRLRELRSRAADDRRARLAQGPRPLRRHIGRLLVTLGQALAGPPAIASDADNASAYKRLAA